MTERLLGPGDLAELDRFLAPTDRLLAERFPGDDGSRQPVHTVYVPADRYTPALPADWGAAALAAAEAQGGVATVVRELGVPEAFAADVAALVEAKLRTEPIEDLRLDFEDGYGDRGDETEDADVRRAAEQILAAVDAGVAPAFIGIRFKCFEAPTRARGIRSLDLFLATLLDAGDLPDGLVLTLPKVTTVAQVEAMAHICHRFEEHHGLTPGRLRFEVQVETPQLILGPDGTSPLATAIHVAEGRVSGLHYGTYDYSASLGISAAYQSMEHPAADHAKNVMQVAAAQTGVRLSDGSTNILPVGDDDAVRAAWRLSARLTRRSLERGYYQGWDLHPAQLVPRFVANTLFYREGLASATTRLRNYVHRIESAVMDEPATARALAAFVLRGVQCGAVTEAEVQDAAGIDLAALTALAHPKPATSLVTTEEPA
ncbi:aldolase [Microbacterium sp. NEAU-LLC]|uniref:Aldolase n=1 Tax=Microbacterium helvum TaxID=2773713 RepID=A0ABR8NRK3_9MICO|nr:aldolase/citrate lyase family protein [Microbacterium helvum]MBD3942794.1 aldolase [Microbacterium helvum]